MTDEHEQQAQAGPEATEAARELAAANMVDLEQVTGTGADGKITKADVEDHLARSAGPAEPPEPASDAAPEPGTVAAAEPVYDAPTTGHAPKVWTGPRR